jgi:hypothetical protein
MDLGYGCSSEKNPKNPFPNSREPKRSIFVKQQHKAHSTIQRDIYMLIEDHIYTMDHMCVRALNFWVDMCNGPG